MAQQLRRLTHGKLFQLKSSINIAYCLLSTNSSSYVYADSSERNYMDLIHEKIFDNLRYIDFTILVKNNEQDNLSASLV